MMARLKAWLRGLAACCAALTVLNGSARADTVDSSARSAVVIERETGTVLLSHNENEPLPMASTTKVMTALMALELGDMDEIVTVGRNAYGVPGTSIYLNLGEQITLKNLLYGLMLASGNDAAVAIAEHLGGDVPTFCRMMTERARELGCTDTVFVNPNGLPVEGHHTTARDLALIAREAMTHPLFREIVSTRRAAIPWAGRSYDRILNNKNRLLSEYEGATGIKTGYTRAAGRCLVFGAQRGGMEIIGVVLNCGDWFNEAARLMDVAFERYELFTAFEAGDVVRAVPVTDGKEAEVSICASDPLRAVVRRGELPMLELELPDNLTAGREAGDVIGEARLTLAGRMLASTPLTLAQAANAQDYAYELERVAHNWLMTAVGE